MVKCAMMCKEKLNSRVGYFLKWGNFAHSIAFLSNTRGRHYVDKV
jgi:hypothetical protein